MKVTLIHFKYRFKKSPSLSRSEILSWFKGCIKVKSFLYEMTFRIHENQSRSATNRWSFPFSILYWINNSKTFPFTLVQKDKYNSCLLCQLLNITYRQKGCLWLVKTLIYHNLESGFTKCAGYAYLSQCAFVIRDYY